jgi:hypothetical protein
LKILPAKISREKGSVSSLGGKKMLSGLRNKSL